MLLRLPEASVDRISAQLGRDLQPQFVRVRSYRGPAGADRRGLRTGGELPQPGRPRHRGARGHRGVERDARLRAREDDEHRGDEVRGRHQRARFSRCTCAGARARAGRQRGRRRARGRGAGRRPERLESDRHACTVQYGLLGKRRAAGPRRRNPDRPAVRADSAAGGAPGEAVDPAAARSAPAAVRLAPARRRRLRRRGACGARVVAGGLLADRRDDVRWVPRAHARPDAGRDGAHTRDASPGRHAILRAAACGAASVETGESDAPDPAHGGARHVLHHGRARIAGESARAVRHADRRRRARPVSGRHPAGSGRRACSSCWTSGCPIRSPR